MGLDVVERDDRVGVLSSSHEIVYSYIFFIVVVCAYEIIVFHVVIVMLLNFFLVHASNPIESIAIVVYGHALDTEGSLLSIA